MPPVEQIKAKRSGTGLRALDINRACPGFTLFAPQSGGGTVYLIDLEGNVTHTWQMPYPPGNSGYLTERGTLFYNGKILEDSKRFISGQPWKGGAALEVDWNGRVLWEVRQPDHHHDGIRLRNGNLLLICLAQLPQDLVPKIKGGMPGTENNGQMYADYLVEMTTAGQVVWEWRTLAACRILKPAGCSRQQRFGNDGRHLTERASDAEKTSPSYADFVRTTRSTSHSRSWNGDTSQVTS